MKRITLGLLFLFNILIRIDSARYSRLQGGIFETDPHDIPEEVIRFTQFSVNSLDFTPSLLSIGEIIKAGTQVVAGTNFYLTFELIMTTCMKPISVNCLPTKVRRVCSAKIYRSLPMDTDPPFDYEFSEPDFVCTGSSRAELREYFHKD